MNKLLVIAGSLLVAQSAFADSSISEVAQVKARKQAFVSAVKERISRHEKMASAGDIINDLEKTTQANLAQLKKSGKDVSEIEKIVEDTINDYRMLGDKDAILAMEQAELNGSMVAANYLFWATRSLWNGKCYNHGKKTCAFTSQTSYFTAPGAVFLTFLTLPFDFSTIVFTGIGTIVSAIRGE